VAYREETHRPTPKVRGVREWICDQKPVHAVGLRVTGFPNSKKEGGGKDIKRKSTKAMVKLVVVRSRSHTT
jgi:hypothetical protein